MFKIVNTELGIPLISIYLLPRFVVFKLVSNNINMCCISFFLLLLFNSSHFACLTCTLLPSRSAEKPAAQ